MSRDNNNPPSNIIPLHPTQKDALRPVTGDSEEILDEARDAVLQETVVIGYDMAGDLVTITNAETAPMLLFMLEQAKQALMNAFFEAQS